jgi:hypothetical protein
MIEAKELRIGNLVYHNKDIKKVWEVRHESVCFYAGEDSRARHCYQNICLKGLSPIPISEEWLMDFGAKIVFVKEIKYYVINGLSFLYNGVDGYYMGLGKAFSVYVESVHKLQNLFYEVRGKELELKDN